MQGAADQISQLQQQQQQQSTLSIITRLASKCAILLSSLTKHARLLTKHARLLDEAKACFAHPCAHAGAATDASAYSDLYIEAKYSKGACAGWRSRQIMITHLTSANNPCAAAPTNSLHPSVQHRRASAGIAARSISQLHAVASLEQP